MGVEEPFQNEPHVRRGLYVFPKPRITTPKPPLEGDKAEEYPSGADEEDPRGADVGADEIGEIVSSSSATAPARAAASHASRAEANIASARRRASSFSDEFSNPAPPPPPPPRSSSTSIATPFDAHPSPPADPNSAVPPRFPATFSDPPERSKYALFVQYAPSNTNHHGRGVPTADGSVSPRYHASAAYATPPPVASAMISPRLSGSSYSVAHVAPRPASSRVANRSAANANADGVRRHARRFCASAWVSSASKKA